MRQAISLAVISLLALAACAPKNDNGNQGLAYGFTEDFHADVKTATPLTAEQKSEIGKLAQAHAGLMPSDSLIYDDYAKDDDGQKQKAADLVKLNKTGKAFLDKVKANCKILPGTPTNSGSLTVGNSTSSVTEKSVSGDKCPVDYSETDTSQTTLTSWDQVSNTYSATVLSDTKMSDNVTDADMKKNPVAIISNQTGHSELTYTGYKADENSNIVSGILHLKGKTAGDETWRDGRTGKVEMKVEVTLSPGQKHFEALMKITLSDGLAIVLGIFGDNQTSEIFLNGEPYTVDQLKEMGWDLGSFTTFGTPQNSKASSAAAGIFVMGR